MAVPAGARTILRARCSRRRRPQYVSPPPVCRRAAFLPRRGARRALEAASATAREGRRPRLANAAFLHWSITGRITEPVTPNLVLMFLLAQNCHTLLARKRTGLLLTRHRSNVDQRGASTA